MAGPNTNFTALSALVNDYFTMKHRALVFNAAPALGRLMKGAAKPEDGDNIRHTLTYQTTKDGAFFDYAPGSTAAEDRHTAAVYEWKKYRQHFTISQPEILRSKGKRAMYKLLDRGTHDSMAAIRDSIATDMFYVSDTNYNGSTAVYGDSDAEIHSLPGLLADATWPNSGSMTIAQIPKSNTWWQGQPTTAGGSFAYTHINTLYYDCLDGSDAPTVAYCHNDQADAIDDVALTAGERFIRNPGQGAKNEFGVAPAVTHIKGVPLFVDSHCNTDHIWMLREPDIQFVVHKDANFIFDGFKEPIDQWSRTGWWYFMGDLTVLDPRRSGVIHTL